MNIISELKRIASSVIPRITPVAGRNIAVDSSPGGSVISCMLPDHPEASAVPVVNSGSAAMSRGSVMYITGMSGNMSVSGIDAARAAYSIAIPPQGETSLPLCILLEDIPAGGYGYAAISGAAFARFSSVAAGDRTAAPDGSGALATGKSGLFLLSAATVADGGVVSIEKYGISNNFAIVKNDSQEAISAGDFIQIGKSSDNPCYKVSSFAGCERGYSIGIAKNGILPGESGVACVSGIAETYIADIVQYSSSSGLPTPVYSSMDLSHNILSGNTPVRVLSYSSLSRKAIVFIDQNAFAEYTALAKREFAVFYDSDSEGDSIIRANGGRVGASLYQILETEYVFDVMLQDKRYYKYSFDEYFNDSDTIQDYSFDNGVDVLGPVRIYLNIDAVNQRMYLSKEPVGVNPRLDSQGYYIPVAVFKNGVITNLNNVVEAGSISHFYRFIRHTAVYPNS